jgi:hypothetical protein
VPSYRSSLLLVLHSADFGCGSRNPVFPCERRTTRTLSCDTRCDASSPPPCAHRRSRTRGKVGLIPSNERLGSCSLTRSHTQLVPRRDNLESPRAALPVKHIAAAADGRVGHRTLAPRLQLT